MQVTGHKNYLTRNPTKLPGPTLSEDKEDSPVRENVERFSFQKQSSMFNYEKLVTRNADVLLAQFRPRDKS